MWRKRSRKDNSGAWEKRSVRKVFYDAPLIKIERNALGWEYTETTEEQTGQDVQYTYMKNTNRYHMTVTPLHDKFYHFKRARGYSKNALFRFVERLYDITAALRRFGVPLVLMTIPFFVLSLLLTYAACDTDSLLPFSLFKGYIPPLIGAAVAFTFVPLILAFIGKGLRKLFKLDGND